MIKYINNAINFIVKQMKQYNQSGLYLLYSDKGMGKTTISEGFKELYANTLLFKCNSIYDIVNNLSKPRTKENFNLNTHLLKPIIKNVKKNYIETIIFDVDVEANKDLFDFIYKIYDTIYEQGIYINVIILIDSKTYHFYQHDFAEYRRLYYLQPLKKWGESDFVALCKSDEQYNFTAAQLNLIQQYSLGNAGNFLRHINMLKYYKYLTLKNKQWELIPNANLEETLQEEYSEIVQKKYNELPEYLKNIIQRTSVVGYIFQNDVLKGAYKITNAKKLIRQIELLTDLLYYTDKELENGKFDSEDIPLQIEKMINQESLMSWCTALVDYYEKKIEKTKLISLERCRLKEKCIVYYQKIGNNEKEIFHYLTLIPLKFNLGQFRSAIDMSKKLAQITNDIYAYKEINAYCLYTQVQINKAIANYTEAIKCLDNYILLITNGESLISEEILALKAELLYDVGDIQSAYDIFSTLYTSNNNNDPNLMVNIISMLSSIEETLNNDNYINHFNKALAYSKDNNMDSEYYKLLRKANMAHYGENSIVLMENAKRYFNNNNLICELIMVYHNIGTESLFYETTIDTAYDKLKSSYKIAKEYGFSQLSYIDNSMAINLIIKGHYKDALEILNRLLTYEEEDFSIISFLLNKVTCLRKLNQFSEASEYLSMAENLNKQPKNNIPFFTSQIIIQKAYFFLHEKQYDDAFEKLQEYFRHNYNDRAGNIVSIKIVLKKLCDMLKVSYPSVIVNFSDTYDTVTQRIAENHLVLCEIMFWE